MAGVELAGSKRNEARRLPQVARRPDASIDSKRPVRILVVEDEWLISTEIEAALLDAGFTVVGVASTAREAVEIAERHRPDIATMDIRLDGDRDGIEAAGELFRQFGIRCLFVSAYSSVELQQRASAVQPLGWISKPFLSAELVRAVADAARAAKGNR